jgi:hypothetical protein
MSIMQSARDTQPLCDQCHEPMVPKRFGKGDAEFAAHLCENDDCQQRVFRIDRGYFNMVEGRPLADKYGIVPCPACDHGANMFLSSITPEEKELWKCPQVGCEYQQIMAE